MCNMLQLPIKALHPQKKQQSHGLEAESHHESRTRRDVIWPEEYVSRCISPLLSSANSAQRRGTALPGH